MDVQTCQDSSDLVCAPKVIFMGSHLIASRVTTASRNT